MTFPAEAKAWARRAEQLAQWAMRLVNRTDAYGRYKAGGGITTEKKPATVETLTKHFRGTEGYRSGLHSTSPENTSRWWAADVDKHDDEPVDPEKNRRFALALYAKVVGLGFRVLLEDSNGRGGFHVSVCFDRPAPTADVFAFGQWAIRDWSAFGLTKAPETFPKQASIGANSFGNWLRLPGLHHTHRHWSKIWSGDRWLAGDEAIDAILQMTGDSPDLIPRAAIAAPESKEPPRARTEPKRPATERAADAPITPLEDFEARTEWMRDILEPAGWKVHAEKADGSLELTRPGKGGGPSATLGHCRAETGEPLLHVFTNNGGPLQAERTYNKFQAWAALKHGGDEKAAGQWLYRNGYGTYRCTVYENGKQVVRLVPNPRPTTSTRATASNRHQPGKNGHAGRNGDTGDDPPLESLTDDELGITILSAVEPKPVEWLWPDRVPLGMFTLLAGEGGLGKSFMTLSCAARVSRGEGWPDHPDVPIPIGDVAVMTAEDDLARTIVPRLLLMGADRERIVSLGLGRRRNGAKVQITLADIALLEEVLRRRPEIRLLIVDPMPAFIGRGIDDHKNAELRMVLGPMTDFAERYRVAIVGITHFSKSPSPRAINRVIGSVAYSNAARATWCVVPDPEDENRRLFLPAKNNLSPDRTGMAFTIGANGVEWEREPIQAKLNEVLAADGSRAKKVPRIEQAAEWLAELLAKGPMSSDDVKAKAKAAGYGRIIWDAKDKAGVKPRKDGMNGGWLWELAPTDPFDAGPAWGAKRNGAHASHASHSSHPLHASDDVPY